MFAVVSLGTGTLAKSNISGDTNGDGNLDNKDVVTLFRFVSGNTEGAVRVMPGEKEGEGKLLIATTTYNSAYTCAEYLLDTYYSEEKGLSFPCDLDIKGNEEI